MTAAILSLALPALAIIICCVVPFAFMAMLAPSLALGRLVPNFRGRRVFPGLGVVWIVWAGCAIVAGIASAALAEDNMLVVLTLLGPLALVAAALGLVDDAYGTSGDRGFRGHFRALVSGRITTGMLKLIGIGAASLVTAVILGQIAPWAAGGWGMRALGTIAAAAAIALTANLINLTDLRPGRALKVYSALATAGCAMVLAAMTSGFVLGSSDIALAVISAVSLLIALLGPVFAVWRFDLGERGMLGDSGANAMGAVAGALISVSLPLWALALYAAAVLALNAIAEKISFSAVIEKTAALKWLDSLGRVAEEPANTESSASPTSDVGGSRYHLEDDHDTQKA